jgi:hypothetical protein
MDTKSPVKNNKLAVSYCQYTDVSVFHQIGLNYILSKNTKSIIEESMYMKHGECDFTIHGQFMFHTFFINIYIYILTQMFPVFQKISPKKILLLPKLRNYW